METTEWMGEYRNGKYYKVSKSTGHLTDIALSTRLNAQEQRELQGRMEKKQMKEFMTVSLVLICTLGHCTPRHSSYQVSPWLCSSRAIRCTRGWSRDALTTA